MRYEDCTVPVGKDYPGSRPNENISKISHVYEAFQFQPNSKIDILYIIRYNCTVVAHCNVLNDLTESRLNTCSGNQCIEVSKVHFPHPFLWEVSGSDCLFFLTEEGAESCMSLLVVSVVETLTSIRK